jgi:hypothetical protein
VQRWVGPEPARGPDALLATVVPALEFCCGAREGVERCDRVAQVIDFIRCAVKVFGGESQSQVAGESSCPAAEAVQGGGVAVIEGIVQDGAGEFGVMGPGAAVDVVRADAGPHIVDDADFGVHVDGTPAWFSIPYTPTLDPPAWRTRFRACCRPSTFIGLATFPSWSG